LFYDSGQNDEDQQVLGIIKYKSPLLYKFNEKFNSIQFLIIHMEFQVIYFTKTGHTKKIAEAIASELNVKAEDVTDAKLNEEGLVFLGSGKYGPQPGKTMMEFIENNNFNSRNVALFGTSGGGKGLEVLEMEKALNAKGACIKGKFFCRGKFMFFNRGRPNDEDINEAKRFAKQMIK
jgi:flavodoxin I